MAEETVTKYSVVVDENICSSCGTCESICPEVFKLDDTGLSTVIESGLTPENYDNVIKAVESCPSGALTLKTE